MLHLRNRRGWIIEEILLFSLVLREAYGETKCLREEAVGDRPENVYYCRDNDKSDCCDEDGRPSCCESKEKQMMREQLILWGSLAAVVLVIVIAICYFWKGINCCRDDVPLREKCCRCCEKKSADDERNLTPIPEPGPIGGISRPWSSSLEHYPANFYNRESPAPPPFRYK